MTASFEKGDRVCWADRSQGAPDDVAATVRYVSDRRVDVVVIRWDHEDSEMRVYADSIQFLDVVTRLGDIAR